MRRIVIVVVSVLMSVVAIGESSSFRSPSVRASGWGGDITLACPAYVNQGWSFACTIGLGTMPDPITGYQFSLIYDSPIGPSGTPSGAGLAFTAVGFTNDYIAATLWGGQEYCPADVLNAADALLPTGYVRSIHSCVSLANPAPAGAIPDFVQFNVVANGLGSSPIHMVTLYPGGWPVGSYTMDGASSPHTNTYICTGANCTSTQFSGDRNLADPIVTVETAPPALVLALTASPDTYLAGQPVSLALSMNGVFGRRAPTDVTVTAALPMAFPTEDVSLSGPGAADCLLVDRIVTCDLGTLTPGSAFALSIDAAATQTNWWHRNQSSCAAVSYLDAGLYPPTGGTACAELTMICSSDWDCDGYTDFQEADLGHDPLTYCATMRADVDGDHVVSILDLSYAARNFGQLVPPAPARADQDGDNAISILDLSRQANVFSQNVAGCP